jgi:hypothetical protein
MVQVPRLRPYVVAAARPHRAGTRLSPTPIRRTCRRIPLPRGGRSPRGRNPSSRAGGCCGCRRAGKHGLVAADHHPAASEPSMLRAAVKLRCRSPQVLSNPDHRRSRPPAKSGACVGGGRCRRGGRSHAGSGVSRGSMTQSSPSIRARPSIGRPPETVQSRPGHVSCGTSSVAVARATLRGPYTQRA